MENLGEKIWLVNTNSYMNRSKYKHGSEEWKKSRASTICGSEIGAFLGLDSQKSRITLLTQKEHPELEKPMDYFSQNMCNNGMAMEPLAIEAAFWYFAESGMRMNGGCIEKYGSLRFWDDSLPIEGDPDGIFLETPTCGPCTNLPVWVPLEVKTRSYPTPETAVPYACKEEVPNKHWMQLQTYMLLLNSPHGYLISYSKNNGFTIYKQDFYPALFTDMVFPLLRQFVQHTIPMRVQSSLKNLVNAMLGDVIRAHTMNIKE